MSVPKTVVRVVVTCALLGAAVGAGTAFPRTPTPDGSNQTTEVPVTQSTLVCPESRAGGRDRTDVTAVALPEHVEGEGADGAGDPRLTIEPLLTEPDADDPDADDPDADDPDADDPDADDSDGDATAEIPDSARVADRGAVAFYPVEDSDVAPLVVRASGALAAGASAGQLTVAGSGELRGLAEAACVRPRAGYWFVGAGSEVGRHGRLYLTNAESVPARVDVTLFDEGGQISTEDNRRILVEPESQRVVELDELAPDSERLAARVRVVEGQVAAALRDDMARDGVPLGVDWIPAAEAPGTDVILPGAAPGPGARVLSLVAPGDSTATVEISVMGEGGTFRPMEPGEIDVEPGTVAEVDVSAATGGEPVAIRLTADAPVAASLRNEFGDGEGSPDAESDDPESDDPESDDPESDDPESEDAEPAADGPRDIAYSAGAAVLTGPTSVPFTPAGAHYRARLMLSSAGERPTTATVSVLDRSGTEVDSAEVAIDPGSTVLHEIEADPDSDGYTMLVTPEAGSQLVGARLLTRSGDDGPLASLWPLSSAPLTITQPVVTSDPSAGLSGDRRSE